MTLTLVCWQVSGQEVNLSGTWELSYRMPDGKEVVQMSLVDNDSLVCATSTIGKFEIKIDDKSVSWSYSLSFKKGMELASFTGEIKSEDRLKGIFIVHHGIYQGRAVRWKAQRMAYRN